MPGLRRIAYVSTDEARLDMRVRGAGGLWTDETAEGLASTAALPEVGMNLPLGEVYKDTELAAAPAA
jgi:hypothetical protein